MEPAQIDWKKETANARYVRDEAYENINCPRWTDLSNPDAVPVDDDAWFCRPDCCHPKTAEDFKRRPPSPKVRLLRSSSEAISRSFSGDAGSKRRGRVGAPVLSSPVKAKGIPASPPAKAKASPLKNLERDAALKRRGGNGAAVLVSPPAKTKAAARKFQEDLENKDPNFPTQHPFVAPIAHKLAKEAIKSSAEKKEGGRGEEELELKKPLPRLRSTLSARNLFSGKDILSQISEFCNELKRMAMRKERSAAEAEPKIVEEKKGLLEEIVEEGKPVQNMDQKLMLMDSRNAGSVKKSSRIPLRVDTGKERWNKGGHEKLMREVRANPPTPQRFSPSSSGNPRKARALAATISSPLSRPPKYTTPERGVLQEIEKGLLIAKDEGYNKDAIINQDVEGRSVDMFWFLKPCTTYLV